MHGTRYIESNASGRHDDDFQFKPIHVSVQSAYCNIVERSRVSNISVACLESISALSAWPPMNFDVVWCSTAMGENGFVAHTSTNNTGGSWRSHGVLAVWNRSKSVRAMSPRGSSSNPDRHPFCLIQSSHSFLSLDRYRPSLECLHRRPLSRYARAGMWLRFSSHFQPQCLLPSLSTLPCGLDERCRRAMPTSQHHSSRQCLILR